MAGVSRASFADSANSIYESFAEFTHTVELYTKRYDPTAGTTVITNKKKFQAIVNSFKSTQIDGEFIRVGDKKLLAKNLDALGVDPQPGMLVEVNSTEYEVINIDDLNTDGILQEIHIRGME